jgi:D-alanine-D-alanine ligase
MKTILLFGGSSEERMVSVASAQNISAQSSASEIWFWNKSGAVFKVSKEELLAHANPFTTEFVPNGKFFAPSLEDALPACKDATLFLALHGTQGEDGALQSLLEKNNILFTGSGSEASRKAFEKDVAKSIVAKAGLTTAPEHVVSAKNANLQGLTDFLTLHKKIVLKPLANGSSIGLHFISDQQTLLKVAAEIATGKFGDYLAETFLAGRELTVGVIDDGNRLRPLPPSEVVMVAGRSFDYQGKYLGQGSHEITPAVISAEETQKVQEMALTAHKALGCYGYSRTDIMLTPQGAVFIETNTLPGLSKASFVPQQLAANDITMSNFIETQLKLASERH